MNDRPAEQPLHKRHLLSQGGHEFISVDAFAVRNSTRADEEFIHVCTSEDFPRLIPEKEVWLSEELVDSEGLYFIAGALARLKQIEAGAAPETAYVAGQNVERFLRRRIGGYRYRAGRPHRRVPRAIYAAHYITLPDPVSAVEVWRVDGGVVRSLYKTDYTEGGHGYVYPWVPKDEIWVEKALHEAEVPYILAHEYLERRLMRDKGLPYDHAHEICVAVEFALRRGKGIRCFLAPDRDKPEKDDLARLTTPEVFHYVVEHHLKK
jgi:hypothetical protein